MDPEREALYETCSRLGVAITVMKAFGGGDLLDEELSPAGKALTVNQCLHYALTRPGVAAVMSGAHTVDELENVLNILRLLMLKRIMRLLLPLYRKSAGKGTACIADIVLPVRRE